MHPCNIFLRQGHIVIYGKRNGGAVLYDDLQLKCPYDYNAIPIMKSIASHELSDYTGDRILLIVDSDEDSQLLWDKLKADKQWQQLRAVLGGKVHPVPECPWLEYSPYAHRIVVQDILHVLNTYVHVNQTADIV